MRQDLIDAVHELKPALVEFARCVRVVDAGLQRVRRESSRSPSELELISMARLYTGLAGLARMQGLGPLLDIHVDAAVSEDWPDRFIANITALISDAA